MLAKTGSVTCSLPLTIVLCSLYLNVLTQNMPEDAEDAE